MQYMRTKLKGIIEYQNIETGFWVLSDKNNKYRIKNMPEELKKEGLKIKATATFIDEMSIFMSGRAIEIIDYNII